MHAYNPKYVARFHGNYLPTPESGCWLWEGPSNGREINRCYGRVWIGRRQFVSAHRFSWQIANGEIPQGMHVCHKCDTPLCVNPDHLFLGTHAKNMDDMASKGRRSVGRTYSKLNPDEVREIRRLLASGHLSQWSIARKFGVSQSTISAIKTGQKWEGLR